MGLFSGASAGVKLDADSTGYRREVKRAARETKKEFGELKKQTRGLRSAFKGLAFGLGAGLAAGIGAVAVAGIAKLKETQVQTAQTNAVIKSTGAAAGVSAKYVGELADAIAAKTGVDDDAIQAGQNMLLTFTNIRDGLGKNNKIFTDSTKIVTDMAVALGQDPKQAALQLGKALNDPAKGITKLTRVGVTFTDQQKAQIEAMSKAGDTAGAQRVILAELNKEFGGSAAAFGTTLPGKLNMAKQAFEDASASIMVAFLPALSEGLGKVNEWIARMQAWSQSASGKETLDALADGARKVGSAIEKAGKLVLGFTGFLIRHRDVVIPLTAALIAAIAAYRAFTIVATAVRLVRALTAGQIALNVAMIANPVGLVIAAIAALVVGLVVAYKKSETFRNILNGVWDFLKKHKIALLALLGPFGLVIAVVVKVVQRLGGFKAVLGTLKGAASTAIDGVKSAFNSAVKFVASLPGKMAKAGSGIWNWLTDGLKNLASGAGGIATKIANGIIRAVNNLLPDKISIPGAPDINLPNNPIPYMAKGGRLTSASLIVAGEDGDEQIVPLSAKYRKQGIANLLEAADALGVAMFARGGRTRKRVASVAQRVTQQLAGAGNRATVAGSPVLGEKQAQEQLRQAAAAARAAELRIAAEKRTIAQLTQQQKRAKKGSAEYKRIDAQLALHRKALETQTGKYKDATAAQGQYADSVVQLRQQIEADRQAQLEADRQAREEAAALVQEQARSAADAAYSFADAEANLAAARAEATAALDDDTAVARRMLELAQQRAGAIEQQLGRGDLTQETRIDLVNQLADATRAQTTLRQRIEDLTATVAGDSSSPGGVTIDPEQMQQLIASNDAFLAGIRDVLRSERSNVTIHAPITTSRVGANQFLEQMRYKLTQSGAGGGL